LILLQKPSSLGTTSQHSARHRMSEMPDDRFALCIALLVALQFGGVV